jgi:predicted nucleotidyltransferase component of viral defense system
VIPRHEIAAWRAHAAWRTDAQVEQDLLLSRAMAAIFADDFLASQVAMRGGTVLHKVHLAPAARYSEDIDLVLVGGRPVSHVRKALARVLRPVLGEPALNVLDTFQLAVRNAVQPSQVARMVYRYRPTVAPPAEMKIKVEVNYSECDPCYAVVDLPYHPPLPELEAPVTLRSYELDEMLGTKLRALLQRTQGRDLFDIHRACVRSDEHAAAGGPALVDPDRVVASFRLYMQMEGSRVFRADFERALAQKLASRLFRGDMTRVLPPGVEFDVDAAADSLRSLFLARLP